MAKVIKIVFFITAMIGIANGFVPKWVMNSMIRNIFKLSNRKIFKDNTIDFKMPQMEDCMYFDRTVVFPEYYKRDFHAYTGGNLDPQSAKEVKAASIAIMKTHYDGVSGYDSSDLVRTSFSCFCKWYYAMGSIIPSGPMEITDLGCGIGVSTRYIETMYRNCHVKGIDLSPYFLEVCSRNNFQEGTKFYHGLAENSRLEAETQDIVSCSYIHHELPYEVSKSVMTESFRILKSGGILCILDMEPRIKASSTLLQFIFDRTEPYLEEYFRFFNDIEEISSDIGFTNLTFEKMPKTSMIFMRKPDDWHIV